MGAWAHAGKYFGVTTVYSLGGSIARVAIGCLALDKMLSKHLKVRAATHPRCR